jgi:hypothetical protein
MSVKKRGGQKHASMTIRQKRIAVILPERMSRHNEPIKRKKNKNGEYVPVIIAGGPTQKKGRLNVPPINVGGKMVPADSTPPWWKDHK